MTTERTEPKARAAHSHAVACGLSTVALAPLTFLLVEGRTEALFALALFAWLAIDLFAEPRNAVPANWWKALPLAAPGLAIVILSGAMLAGYRIDMSAAALLGATVFAAIGISAAYRVYRLPAKTN